MSWNKYLQKKTIFSLDIDGHLETNCTLFITK